MIFLCGISAFSLELKMKNKDNMKVIKLQPESQLVIDLLTDFLVFPLQHFNAKISDFGLAKNGPLGGASHVTTRVLGTYGYAAPEYMATGHLYVKSDVYGFGVVLLEVMTGHCAFDTNRPGDQHNLVDWAKPFLSDRRKLVRIMDSRLEGQYHSRAAHQAAQLALNCLASEPKKRPHMKEVAETLQQIEKSMSPEGEGEPHRHQSHHHHRSPYHSRHAARRER